MEIPSNEFRLKNKIIQDRAKVSSKESSGKGESSESSSKAGGSSEQIVLSSKAKDIQRAQEAVRAAPDIRTDKVNRIKQELSDGTYKVNTRDVAEKMLKNILNDAKFLE
jgi:negative regulator of flagellin synthesis FlgM